MQTEDTLDTQLPPPSVRWLTLCSICIATFLMPMSLSSVNVALPAIASSLQADAVLVSWMPTMNLLGAIILQLPAGRIADIMGHKKIFLAGIILFVASSLAVLFVDDIRPLLAVRLIQGVAGAMVFAPAMAIISHTFSGSQRGMALGLTLSSVYTGLTCGPLIGGWLTEYWGWHSVFVAPLPFALLSVISVVAFVKESTPKADERLDWIGSLIFIVATSSLFIGIAMLPEAIGIVLSLIGGAMLALFVYQQERSPYPLIRFRRLVANRVFLRSIQSCFMMYSGNVSLQFMLSLYLQYIRGLSPSDAGKLMLLQAMVMAIVSPLSGRLSDRVNPRIPATAGCLLFFFGFISLAMVGAETSLWGIAITLLMMGLGFGLFSSPNNNSAMSAVPPERLGIASSMINMSRSLGNMLGMTVVVLLFNVMIGNAQIEPEQYPALMQVLRISFVLCAGFAIVAAFASWDRGGVRN